MTETTGARRAMEWFLGTSHKEPSDSDLLDLHRFLRDLVERIDSGAELNLLEWEVLAARSAPEHPRSLN